MTDEQILKIAREACRPFPWGTGTTSAIFLDAVRAVLAAGASEGQAFDAWFDREYPLDDLGRRSKYQGTNVLGLMQAAWNARDAEIAALRERIAGMEKDARDAGPTAWRYETDYGTIYQSTQLDHTYADANGDYIKGTPLYLAPCPSTTKFEPATRVVMTYEGENFSDVDRALPFGTPLFTAAQMRQAERDALERAAALIEPKNDMDDWTDWARTRYEAAQQIRGLKEPKQ